MLMRQLLLESILGLDETHAHAEANRVVEGGDGAGEGEHVVGGQSLIIVTGGRHGPREGEPLVIVGTNRSSAGTCHRGR